MTEPVDAVILVGGQGTRLRPLTLSAPKPMLPTAGVPFLEHQLSRIKAAGIRHVVLGTSYKAHTFTEYFGDGAAWGLSIEYVVEDQPLGTGGAIRNVLDRVSADTVMIFNGDILSGVDLQALLATHHDHDADVTLHLVRVDDARAFGSVPTDPTGRVVEFCEKSENPPTNNINAGCYVFRRSVIERMPADTVISVERETFPQLLRDGAVVMGHVDDTYWLDLGTPAAFVTGSCDLVLGNAPTAALPGPVGAALALPDSFVADDAVVCGGTTVGRLARIESGALVDGSVVFDGAQIAGGARVVRSVVGKGAVVGPQAVVVDAVIGDGAQVGGRCELISGARVWPGVELPEGGIRFSAES